MARTQAPVDLPIVGGRGDKQRQGHATLAAIRGGGADAKNQGRQTNLSLEGGGREQRQGQLEVLSLPSKLREGEGAIIMVEGFLWCESGISGEE